MSPEIILTQLGDSAEAIIETFADKTRLTKRDDRVTFSVNDDADHEVSVVQTLTEIDPNWTDHGGFGLPPG